VAIERHRKVRAIVCSPETFSARAGSDIGQAERRAARTAQALVERDRLIKHQRVALRLLLAPLAEQRALLTRARQEVDRWEHDHLCSADSIDAWRRLLDLPVRELAEAMGRDDETWGIATRQNSPWHVVPA